MTNTDSSRIGTKVPVTTTGKPLWAYMPPPLPPRDLDLAKLAVSLTEASRALGELHGISSVLPDFRLFLGFYIRKEAVLSSQIEGTQSTLSDLLLFESEAGSIAPKTDVQEVWNLLQALKHGFDQIRKGFPISSRLIREMHGKLLTSVKGGSKAMPGEFRRSQNWIGGTSPENASYVPPPQQEVVRLMSDLEKYINQRESKLPALIKIALVHVQFETIHPFLDGNGRIGRILIALLLCSEGVLDEPMFYLSLCLKRYRKEYYGLLQRVRETGGWDAWLDFFLKAAAETSRQAISAIRDCLKLFEEDRKRIEETGRRASSMLRVHDCLQKFPIINIAQAAGDLGISRPTIGKAVAGLVQLGVLKEITGKQRGQIFVYRGYLDILDEGTEPIGDNDA